VEGTDQEDLTSVLAAIRKMVQQESRAQFSDSVSDPDEPDVEVPPVFTSNVVSKVLILYPHMRVDIPKVKPEVLDDEAKIPYDSPIPAGESFAIANDVDDFVLRDMVRDIVQQELRGDLGREIIEAMKKDVLLSLTDKT